MRKLAAKIAMFFIIAVAGHSYAQDTISTSVQHLDEIVIEGNRMEHYPDKDVYYPSRHSKKNAANALDLLSHLHLRGLFVDVMEKSVTARRDGNVQIRINGVISAVEDLQTILPEQVLKVDYITLPSAQYGQGVAAVVDVKVRRLNNGYAIGINAMNAISTNYNDDGVWAKFIHRASEIGISYNYKLNGNANVWTRSQRTYLLDGGVDRTVSREGKYDDCHFNDHLLTLSYRLQTQRDKQFSATLQTDWNKFPDRKLNETVNEDGRPYEQTTVNKGNSRNPVLRLYYAQPVGKNNSLSIYGAFSHIKSAYQRGFTTDLVSNSYNVRGQKSGFLARLEYSHTFADQSVLHAGYQQEGAYTSNRYDQGGILQHYGMHDDSQYLYADYSCRYRRFDFVLGMGGSRNHFSAAGSGYTYWMVRPQLTVRYAATDRLSLYYQYVLDNGLPLLSQLTEFSKSENLYETTVGNGRLTPYRMNKNLVMAAYDLGERYLALQINCDHSPHIIADRRVIRENDTFIYSFDNNQDHTRLEVDLYAESYFFNKKIHFYVMPCFTREVVRGDYTHRNTHFSVTAGGHAYIGNFTVACNYISPAESLQGETLARQSGSTDFSCAYRHRRLSIKLGMRNLFNSHGSSTRIRRLSDMVSGVNETCNKAFGNMFYCSLSWNLVKAKNPNRIA